MNKNLGFILFFCWVYIVPANSQNPTLYIRNNNITGEVKISDNAFTANSCLIGLLGSVQVRASGNFSPVPSPPIPLSKIKLLVTGIGSSLITLLDGASEQALSTSDRTLYAALATIASTGPVTIQYRIPAEEMTNFAWKAGTYTTNLTYTTPAPVALNLCLGQANYANTLRIIVEPFISSDATPVTLQVNDLNHFRSSGVSAVTSLPSRFTVPPGFRIKSATSLFNYTAGYLGAPNPSTGVNTINVKTIAPTTGSDLSLNTGYQNLSPTGGFTIPAGNFLNPEIQYSISAATLRNSFVQKGTYATTLNYQAFDAGTNPVAATVSNNTSLQVEVADIGELQVNTQDITLAFTNVNDYAQGVSVNLSNALTISKTTAFDVTIKTAGTHLTKGSDLIPVQAVSVESATGDPYVNTVQLSPTAQNIISSHAPVIDKQVDLRYTITAANVSHLMNKAAGTYSTTLTFSLVAP